MASLRLLALAFLIACGCGATLASLRFHVYAYWLSHPQPLPALTSALLQQSSEGPFERYPVFFEICLMPWLFVLAKTVRQSSESTDDKAAALTSACIAFCLYCLAVTVLVGYAMVYPFLPDIPALPPDDVRAAPFAVTVHVVFCAVAGAVGLHSLVQLSKLWRQSAAHRRRLMSRATNGRGE